VWDWDFATDRVTWSETHEAICGLAPHSFPGTLEAFLTAVHPDDRDAQRAVIDRFRIARAGGRCEFRIMRPNGMVRWLMASGSTVTNDRGRPTGLAGVAIDVTDYKYADGVRMELQRQLVNAQEEERRRIARELHDHMGQHLAALVLGLQTLVDSTAEPVDRSRIQQLQVLTRVIGREVHDLALQLRPPALDDLGLLSALEQYTDQWSSRYHVPMDLHTSRLKEPRLPPPVEIALYRIVQEGLTNVARHAHATRVSLVVQRRAGFVQLILEDDGRGFPVDEVMQAPHIARRLGILGMRERACLAGGTLDVESAPGRGTTIFVRVPVARRAHPTPDR
jgi:PAS domain S-box-containing protein